jgi:single-stranded DNA-specific DHH superfamily exonuclease
VIDRQLDLAEIPHAQKELLKLAPFGQSNEKPLFVFPSVNVSRVKTFGKGSDHLELELSGSAQAVGCEAFHFFQHQRRLASAPMSEQSAM